MRRSTLHFWLGFVGLILFALAGQYMAHGLDALAGMEDGARMAWRSSHIYFLLACAMNLVRGIYPSRFDPASRAGKLEALASPLMLVAPLAYLASFFLESSSGVSARHLTLAGSVMVLGACVLLSGTRFVDRR